MPTEMSSLAQLVEDARKMPTTVLPRPRTSSDEPKRSIDLTVTDVQIPAETVSLVDGYADYGS